VITRGELQQSNRATIIMAQDRPALLFILEINKPVEAVKIKDLQTVVPMNCIPAP
jgi:hypothetical protein